MRLKHQLQACRRTLGWRVGRSLARGRTEPARKGTARGVLASAAVLLASAAPAAPSAPPAVAAPVPGQVRVNVTLVGSDGSRKPAADAVAWLPGALEPEPADSAVAKIAQQHKAFEPHVEVVPAGSAVAFPN